MGPGWDAVYNYDPDTGVHRDYDAAAVRRGANRRVGQVLQPPQKPWDELSQLERDRGYDFYGRTVSEPAETGEEVGAGEKTGPGRPSGTGWV